MTVWLLDVKLTLDTEVVSIGKVLFSQAWPLFGDLTHFLGTVHGKYLQWDKSRELNSLEVSSLSRKEL